jgi:hypothetical protein
MTKTDDLEFELHVAQNLKHYKFEFNHLNFFFEKIPWHRQCCTLSVCNFSEQNMLYFDSAKMENLDFVLGEEW